MQTTNVISTPSATKWAMSTAMLERSNATPPGSVIRAITFDIGDTLVFDRPSRAERVFKSLKIVGVEPTANQFTNAFRIVERDGVKHYLAGIPPDDPTVAFELASGVVQNLTGKPNASVAKAMLEQFTAMSFQRYVQPDALLLLTRLRQNGFKIGVISDWESDLPDILQELKILHYFDTLSISAVVGVTKPHHVLFDDAVRKLQMLPSEILHVGDFYELDCAGAINAGLHAILLDLACRYEPAQLDVPVMQTFDQLTTYLSGLKLPQ